jgi:hypothetical protein
LFRDKHGQYQKETASDHLIEGRHACEDHAIVQHAENDDAEHAANDRSFAARQRATAEDRSRDGLQPASDTLPWQAA